MESGKDSGRRQRCFLPAMICMFLLLMCGVTYGASTLIARADTYSGTENAEISDGDANQNEWYTVDEDGRILSVYLSNRINGYCWKYGSSNDLLRQLSKKDVQTYLPDYDMERFDGNFWEVHLMPKEGSEGEVDLTFVYVRDLESSSIDTRNLKADIENGTIQVTEE